MKKELLTDLLKKLYLARLVKNYTESDRIRAILNDGGWKIDILPNGNLLLRSKEFGTKFALVDNGEVRYEKFVMRYGDIYFK